MASGLLIWPAGLCYLLLRFHNSAYASIRTVPKLLVWLSVAAISIGFYFKDYKPPWFSKGIGDLYSNLPNTIQFVITALSSPLSVDEMTARSVAPIVGSLYLLVLITIGRARLRV